MSSLVSNIGQVTGDEYLGNVSSEANMTQAFQRFKEGCKLFVRSIASPSHPIVIFLDDLQWIDRESRGILQDLLTDKSCNILLIGAYRCDEATSHEVVEMFQFEANDFHFNTTRITLSNLDKQGASELIAICLGMPTDTVIELSDAICSKTNGNPFYTKEMLSFLEYEGLIRHIEDTAQWAWDSKDINDIRYQIDVTDNVLHILEQKLDRFTPKTRKLLTVASYIGFFFRKNVLTDFIVEEEVADGESRKHSRKRVKKTLRNAVKEGVIEEAGVNGYRFAHDKIQQCVLKMVDDEEHVSLSCRLGWFLHARIPSYGQQEVFPAAENLIKGLAMITDPEDRLTVVKICLTAGLAAKSRSSFHSAGEFAGAGLDILGSSLPWASQRDLVMSLLTLTLESRQALGKVDDARAIIAQILENTKSNREKWPAHKALIEDIATSGEFADALKKSLTTLREYGDGYPKKPNLIHLIGHYRRVKKLLKRMSDDDLLNLSEISDSNLITTMELYKVVQGMSFLINDELNFALSVLRGLEFSVKHGYSVVTPSFFAGFGLLCCSFGDVSSANRYGDLSVRMLDHWTFFRGRARVYLTREGLYFHLRHTAKACADGLNLGVLDGFKSGEHEDAMYCACLYSAYLFNSGMHLSDVAFELHSQHDKFASTKSYVVDYLRFFWAATLNLLGESEDPVALTIKDTLNEHEALQLAINFDDKLQMFAFRSLKASLLFHFGYLERAYVYVEEIRKEKRLGIQDDLNLFYFGLMYVDMYRKSVKKRKHLSLTRRSLKGLGRHGGENPNTKAPFYLLDAELYAITKKSATVEAVLEKYDVAATTASEGGLIQFEALANERAALAIRGRDAGLANERMRRAKQLYLGWGANAIVEYLDENDAREGRFDGGM